MKTLLIGVILSAVLGDSDVDPIEFHRQKSRDGQINPNDPFGKQLLLRKTKSQEIAIVSSGELLHKAQDQAVCDALMKHFIRDFLDHLKPHLNQNSEVDVSESAGPICSFIDSKISSSD